MEQMRKRKDLGMLFTLQGRAQDKTNQVCYLEHFSYVTLTFGRSALERELNLAVLHRAHSLLASDRHDVTKVDLRQLPIWKLLRRAAVVATKDRCKVLRGTEAAHLSNLNVTQIGMFGE